jgi:thiol peroxidase
MIIAPPSLTYRLAAWRLIRIYRLPGIASINNEIKRADKAAMRCCAKSRKAGNFLLHSSDTKVRRFQFMANVTLRGKEIHTIGTLPAIGSGVPDFRLTKQDLSEIKVADLAGKKVIYNIFPSIDTATCATSVRKFNEQAAAVENTTIVCVSADLPFALKRFCGAEGINNVVATSDLRDKSFGKTWGLTFTDGPLEGLLSRAVVVTDANGKVVYTEQVAEVGSEPDYDKALAAAKSA